MTRQVTLVNTSNWTKETVEVETEGAYPPGKRTLQVGETMTVNLEGVENVDVKLTPTGERGGPIMRSWEDGGDDRPKQVFPKAKTVYVNHEGKEVE